MRIKRHKGTSFHIIEQLYDEKFDKGLHVL
jgi:hypothetical protein